MPQRDAIHHREIDDRSGGEGAQVIVVAGEAVGIGFGECDGLEGRDVLAVQGQQGVDCVAEVDRAVGIGVCRIEARGSSPLPKRKVAV